MPRSLLRFDQVSFSYESTLEPLLVDVSITFPQAWTGIVGPNGAGKTTLLRLALRDLVPSNGAVVGPVCGAFCEQRTDSAPLDLAEFLASVDSEACTIRGKLKLSQDWSERWTSLSHGERKRAQLAVALWHNPPILALDEPTNHLDRAGKNLVLNALRAYDGIGLLVSHDRDLLDELCVQCVFVHPPNAIPRPGGYSAGSEQLRLERETLLKEKQLADRTLKTLRQEANRRREQALKGERQRTKRGLDKNDHDAKARVYLARVTDGGSGQRLRQLDGRLAQAQERKAQLRVERDPSLGVTLLGQRSPRRHLLALEAAQLCLGPDRQLQVPALVILPDDRIAVVGSNGSGKSTVVEHLIARAELPSSRIAYVPQEIDIEDSRAILRRFRQLPPDQLGRAMTMVSRLGSSPQRLLESDCPSPGELRKLLLSACIVAEPFLVVLDEPTNHLDLPSIECLENALEECQAALILVSHDHRFLSRLTSIRWEIRANDRGTELVVVH